MVKLIAKQHLLPSVRWVLEQADRVGNFTEIDLLCKDYSKIASVGEQLPTFVKLRGGLEECFGDELESDLVILDEGGSLHLELPVEYARRSAGIEQTTYGLRNHWKYPVVLVCRSAAKLYFESQIIARGIIRKLESIDLLEGKTFGIIGLGALGSSIARLLMAKGISTVGTDIRSIPPDLSSISLSLPDLIKKSNVILGCTGVNVLDGVDVCGLNGTKLFASCSSSDIEFRVLLGYLPVSQKFESVKGTVGKMNCVVLNGGFPINFDRVREWELFEEIILTRRLVLQGLLQAKSLIRTRPAAVMLDPAIQQQIVLEWLEQVPDRSMLRVPEILNEDFYRKHSEGEIQMNEKPLYTLHNTTPGALNQMRMHKAPYHTDVMGLPILVLPGVWSPAYDWSSLFYVENMPDVRGLDFLEIGCGTGVISVFAGRAGANRIVAVDVNPEAVRNARRNFDRFGTKMADAFLSDGFSNVKGKFDLITWNAPYHGCRPADMLERGCADECYRDIRSFFQQVRTYLNPGGKVVFGFSESGDLPLVESLIADNGFRIRRKLSDWREDYNCMLFELVEANQISK